MLSVLIPVFNVDVVPLVAELERQILDCGIKYEIVLADDASTNAETLVRNRSLLGVENVRCFFFQANQGRSKIRNFLVDKAEYEVVLLMDCDARIKHTDYIRRYISYLTENRLNCGDFVVCGGVSYRETAPGKDRLLRYRYGKLREVRPASKREENPYSSFTPFNIFFSKRVFDKCRFDETLTQYGFEDTFFGYSLKENAIPVYHIDNELYHDGIDTNAVFVSKIAMSCENLARLCKEGRIPESFVMDSRLLRTYKRMSSTMLGKCFLRLFSVFCGSYYRLAVMFSSVRALDCFKLSKFSGLIV